MFRLSKLETVDEAVAKLLELAEYRQIFRWFQFPTALVVFHSTWLWCRLSMRLVQILAQVRKFEGVLTSCGKSCLSVSAL